MKFFRQLIDDGILNGRDIHAKMDNLNYQLYPILMCPF